MARRKRTALTAKKLRSALTIGSSILGDGIDHRTGWMRRFRDLLCAHQSDLGGDEILSIIRRAAMLELQCEMLEAKFANSEASRIDLELYQRCDDSLRRLLESLELNRGRVARTVEPVLNTILRAGVEERRRLAARQPSEARPWPGCGNFPQGQPYSALHSAW
jgi:hypothetical protein